jgi:RHS repeat-associated protein
MAYDAAGNLLSTTDRLGRLTTYAYDALNRQTGATWTVSSVVTNVQTFTYDAASNQLTAADANGAYTMAYDALNRETSVQEPFGQALTYTYDAAGNRTVVQDSQGGTTTSVYDALNQLTSRQFGGPGQTTLREDFTYTARDQVATENRYTDLAGTSLAGTSSYVYDAAERLTKLTQTYANGTVLASYVYNYDQASRLTSEVDNGGATIVYSYDNANQLTGAGTATYGYDATGNRTNTGYQTGPNNQLLNDGTYTYTYDAEGNLQTKSTGTDLTTYSYDNQNRLTGVIETVGGTLQTQATYVYDVFGNRIEADEYTLASGVTTVTRYAYDGANAWADLSSTNALVTRRLYLPGQDQLMASISAGGTAAWYLIDRQGSVRNLQSYSGSTALDTIAYDAFGNLTSESTPANGDRYKYTGREWDAAVGLQYNRARYYNPANGRWISQDPLGLLPDANEYRYVRNGPINATDPTGQSGIVEITSEKQARDILEEQIATWKEKEYNLAAHLLEHFLGKPGANYVLTNADRDEIAPAVDKLVLKILQGSGACPENGNNKGFNGHVRWTLDPWTTKIGFYDSWYHLYEWQDVDERMFYTYGGADLSVSGTVSNVKFGLSFGLIYARYDWKGTIKLSDNYSFQPTGPGNARLEYASYAAAHYLEVVKHYPPFNHTTTWTDKKFTDLVYLKDTGHKGA